VTIFEIDPATYELKRRYTAERATYHPWGEGANSSAAGRAGWVFTAGWEREMGSGGVARFEPFELRAYPELREAPAYFLKEAKPYTQMNFRELGGYIDDLRRSGFDVVPLTVQLQRKFSYPFTVLVMALLALPFAFSMGRRGALTGIALSLGIAMAYQMTASLFEPLGNLNQLPPIAAAWSPNLLFGLYGLYMFLRIRT
jgi:hypothetical protein